MTSVSSRSGFTLMEILIATVLIGLIAVGVGRLGAESSRALYNAEQRETARLIAGEILERHRSAPPTEFEGDTVRMTPQGTPAEDGRFRVTSSADTLCLGRRDSGDNADAEPFLGDGDLCEDRIPVLQIEVNVEFMDQGGRFRGGVQPRTGLVTDAGKQWP